MDKGKEVNWKDGLLLLAVSYLLYIIIWLVLDYETARQLPETALIDYMVDFLLCILFTYTLLEFCYIVFSVFPLKASYVKVIVYASCLLMLNNLVALGMISLFNFLWSGTGDSVLDRPLNMKGVYTFTMIAAFLSSVHTNIFCLRSYVRVRNEEQALEMVLMKEKEIVSQSQLNSLRLQINPHFMFNNFSNLLGLIEEDAGLAGRFLNNLSKAYRYIIVDLGRDLIPITDEIRFLDLYLFLMKIRYGGGIITKISPEVKGCKGFPPPAVLQLLVENAIKHNGFSMEHPLFIPITLSENCITVYNLKSPLLSRMKSTGLGHKNIVERYALLCNKKVKIKNTESSYSMSLPIVRNIMTHEDTGS